MDSESSFFSHLDSDFRDGDTFSARNLVVSPVEASFRRRRVLGQGSHLISTFQAAYLCWLRRTGQPE